MTEEATRAPFVMPDLTWGDAVTVFVVAFAITMLIQMWRA